MALLELKAVSKHFGAIEALAGIDFHLHPGEIVGLMGDNGAGKSTMVKIVAGNFPPSGGEIRLAGAPVRFARPVDARAAGIEVVYQDLALCNNLTASANVFLGREKMRRFGPLRRWGTIFPSDSESPFRSVLGAPFAVPGPPPRQRAKGQSAHHEKADRKRPRHQRRQPGAPAGRCRVEGDSHDSQHAHAPGQAEQRLTQIVHGSCSFRMASRAARSSAVNFFWPTRRSSNCSREPRKTR